MTMLGVAVAVERVVLAAELVLVAVAGGAEMETTGMTPALL